MNRTPKNIISNGRIIALVVSVYLAACASTEPHLVSGDEWLEQEARRNEVLAEAAERSGAPEAGKIYREKAAEHRASRKSSRTVSDTAADFGFDVLLSFLFGGLERGAKK
jgi:hypothetical protein